MKKERAVGVFSVLVGVSMLATLLGRGELLTALEVFGAFSVLAVLITGVQRFLDARHERRLPMLMAQLEEESAARVAARDGQALTPGPSLGAFREPPRDIERELQAQYEADLARDREREAERTRKTERIGAIAFGVFGLLFLAACVLSVLQNGLTIGAVEAFAFVAVVAVALGVAAARGRHRAQIRARIAMDLRVAPTEEEAFADIGVAPEPEPRAMKR